MNASNLLRIRRLILPLLGLMLAGSLTGCDSGSSESDAASGDFTFTALVNGERYMATSIIGAGISASGDVFIVSGNDDHTLEIGTEGAATGAYSVEGGTGSGLFTIRASSSIYSTSTGSTGTITVDELTDDRIVGTFSFTAEYLAGVGDPELGPAIVVTEGEFDVPRVRA